MPKDDDPYPVPPVVYRGQRPPPGKLDPAGQPGNEIWVILYVGFLMIAGSALAIIVYNLLREWKVLP